MTGPVEPGEAPAEAALRELFEESGLRATAPPVFLAAAGLPDAWSHRAADDGGWTFRFLWHDLGTPPDTRWHPVFAAALARIAAAL